MGVTRRVLSWRKESRDSTASPSSPKAKKVKVRVKPAASVDLTTGVVEALVNENLELKRKLMELGHLAKTYV